MNTMRSLLTHPDAATEREIARFYAAPFDSEELYLRSLAKYRGEAAPPQKTAPVLNVSPVFRAVTAAACLLVTLGIVTGVWAVHRHIRPIPPEDPAATAEETTEPYATDEAVLTEQMPATVLIPETELPTEALTDAAADPTEPQPTADGSQAQPGNTAESQAAASTEPVISTGWPTEPAISTVPTTEPAETTEPTEPEEVYPMERDGFRIEKVELSGKEMLHLVWLGEVTPSPEDRYYNYTTEWGSHLYETRYTDRYTGQQCLTSPIYIYGRNRSLGYFQYTRSVYEIYLEDACYADCRIDNSMDPPAVWCDAKNLLFWDDGYYTFQLSGGDDYEMDEHLMRAIRDSLNRLPGGIDILTSEPLPQREESEGEGSE